MNLSGRVRTLKKTIKRYLARGGEDNGNIDALSKVLCQNDVCFQELKKEHKKGIGLFIAVISKLRENRNNEFKQ